MVACGSGTSTPMPPITDAELDAAIKQAHSTLSILLQAMIAPKPSYYYLGIKISFTTPDGQRDDNWTEPVDYADGIFTIRMLDGLTYNHNLHIDHTVNVPLRRVVDWMIVEKDGTLIGGYTIRLTYEHLTQDEKKEFLKNTGYIIK